MANITRDEARARAELLSVDSYEVDLDLTQGAEQFTSSSTIRFSCREPGAGTFLEMIGTVREVILNGTALDAATVVDGDRITLDGLAATNTVVVRADATYSRSGEGLHRFVDPEDGAVYLYSQCAVYDAQRIFACFDQPDLKARFTMAVTADPAWTVLANTVPADRSPGRVVFAPTEQISTYLVAVCAGDYVGVHAEHDGIDLGVWCRRALVDHLAGEEVLEYTRFGLDYYRRAFGIRYPFGSSYDQVMVPEFNLGAMENPGCVTFREEQFVHRSRITEAQHGLLAQVILHEMAHMWFGNLVTMTWWDDLWLNESFADYMGYRLPTELPRFADEWTAFCIARKAGGYAADQRPTTHPIAGDLPDLKSALMNFDGISYAKGASVLKQLVATVGEESFLTGVRAYFAEHAWGNTRFTDLLSALSTASGRDLTSWAAAWLQTAGVNTLRADVTAVDGRYAEVSVVQEAPADHPTLRPHHIDIGAYDLRDGGLVERAMLPVDVAGERTAVPALVGQPVADLLLLNDGDLTFAKTRLDERSLQTVRQHVELLPNSLSRAVCWAALWDMVRDAEVPVSAFVRAACRAAPYESMVELLSRVLAQARLGIDRYAAPEHRHALLAELAGCALAQVHEQPPGSDSQLELARAFVGAAGEPEVGTLRSWLAAREVPEGLEIDRELRWAALGRLAVLGRVDRDDIETEHAADPSQAGDLAAAYALAALPDAGSKAAAWSALFADDSLPNSYIERMAAGFWQAEHVEVLQQYRERFFRDIVDVAGRRTAFMVISLAVRGYPHVLVDAETAAASEVFLDGDLDTIVRRMVTEQQSELVRALAARACDAAG